MLEEWTKDVEMTVDSVIKKNNKYFCQRCLNNDQSLFFKDELGVYCRRCLIFGKSATYKKIRRNKVLTKFPGKYCLNKKITLSKQQEKASKTCLESLYNCRDLLVFAVCGAGKTEIVYEVILKALNDEKIVCFATPRKDVVLELVPRLKRDFKGVHIVSLYGESTDKGKVGNLYVSTTHQLMNYYHYFDLVILDEVDAFPYYNNRMLEGFISKAKKREAPIIMLTATPTKRLQYLMKSKRLTYVVIPSRHHGHPIPIPKVKLTNNTINNLKKNQCPKKIVRWLIEKRELNKQCFIFVPNIECGKQLQRILKEAFDCQFVYAEMKERKSIVKRFRERKLQFIITTTILERGVTVSNVDLCVIGCDDDIFDERAIVQIAGRAGRDKDYPNSDVVLFADYYTIGIKKALRHIKRMNRLGKNEMHTL